MHPGKLLLRLFVQMGVAGAVMAGLLLGGADSWRWLQGWTFLTIFFLGGTGFGLWLVRRDPGLLAARLSPPLQRGQPLWDKIFFAVFIPGWCGWLLLMALDAQRWHSSDMPIWLNVLGGALVIAGFFGVMGVFHYNSFAAPVVRLQAERAHRVIDSGPYAVVRHPMYAAALLYLAGLPLLLGSWYGLALLPLIVAGLAPRAVFEERLLQRELPGYADYTTRVRWRLIPYLW